MVHGATQLESPMDAQAHLQEARLCEAARQGNGKAFADLVKPHLTMLHALAWRYAQDAALAEDAVQETLMLVYDQLGRYQPGTSFRAWIASIAVRRAFTLRRSALRRIVREQSDTTEPVSASAEAHLDAAQKGRRLASILDRMPPMRRQAVMLRMDAGLPHAEIALALGTSEESVRVLVHMGLKEIRQSMAEESK